MAISLKELIGLLRELPEESFGEIYEKPREIKGTSATVGNVPSLTQAIEDDESGKLFALWINFRIAEDAVSMRYYLKQILYFLTGATDIAPNSRGGNIDARDLHVIKQFMGRDFGGINGANPNSSAAEILKPIYTDIENDYFNIANLQAAFGGYMTATYEFIDGNQQNNIDFAFLNYVRGLTSTFKTRPHKKNRLNTSDLIDSQWE